MLGVAVLLLVLLLVTGGVAQATHLLANQRYGDNAPVCRVTTSQKLVALSFDDGPSAELTAEALSILQANGAHATFFVQGDHVDANTALLREEAVDGMEIGNHTWSHPDLTDLSDDAARAEIERSRDAISSHLAPASVSDLFRAPYGVMTSTQAAMVRTMGYVPLHWSIAIDHFVNGLGMTPREAADAIAKLVKPGDILLAHDGPFEDNVERHAAMDTVSALLPILRERGFSVTTIGGLLASGTPVLASPRTWFWQSGFSCPAA